VVSSDNDSDIAEIQRLLRDALREISLVAGSREDYVQVVDDVLLELDERPGSSNSPEVATLGLDGLVEVGHVQLAEAQNALVGEADGLSDLLAQIERLLNRLPRSGRAMTPRKPLPRDAFMRCLDLIDQLKDEITLLSTEATRLDRALLGVLVDQLDELADSVEFALSESDDPDEQIREKSRLLRAFARALAKVPEATQVADQLRTIVTILTGGVV